MNDHYSSGCKAALKQVFSHDYENKVDPQPSYATIRMLEKKGLVYVYRRLNDWTEYPAPKRNNPSHTVRRRTIYTVILLYDGLRLLGHNIHLTTKEG